MAAGKNKFDIEGTQPCAASFNLVPSPASSGAYLNTNVPSYVSRLSETIALAKIAVLTDVLLINPGEDFTLPDWSSPTLQQSKDVPEAGVRFLNGPETAAALHQEVLGKITLIYITPEGLLPPNTTDVLTRKANVKVWFQRHTETGEMVDEADQNAFGIAVTSPTISLSYNEDGSWSLKTQTIYYMDIK